jgi:hypothetical protein
MNEIAASLTDDRTTFRAGERVEGRALWVFANAPESVEVRLFWHTSGKGDDEIGVVATHRVDMPSAAGDDAFALDLPTRPWSWHGKLVSLDWALEVVAQPGEQVFRIDLDVRPPASD